MRPGEANQPSDLIAKLRRDMLFGELRAELFIVRSRRIVDDVVPPDGFRQNLTLGR